MPPRAWPAARAAPQPQKQCQGSQNQDANEQVPWPISHTPHMCGIILPQNKLEQRAASRWEEQDQAYPRYPRARYTRTWRGGTVLATGPLPDPAYNGNLGLWSVTDPPTCTPAAASWYNGCEHWGDPHPPSPDRRSSTPSTTRGQALQEISRSGLFMIKLRSLMNMSVLPYPALGTKIFILLISLCIFFFGLASQSNHKRKRCPSFIFPVLTAAMKASKT